jgi:hypothetical protein
MYLAKTRRSFALLEMNLSKCPGCQRNFAKGGAIRVHQRACNGLRSAAFMVYRRRNKNQKREGLAKLRCPEGLTPEDLANQRQDIRDEVNYVDDLPHARVSSSLLSS